MASSGGGAEFVDTTRGLIFAPTEAYGLQLKAWNASIADLCSRVEKASGKTFTADDLAQVAQIVNDAILSGTVAPAPVLTKYSGHDDLTTDVKQTDQNNLGASVGGTLSVVSLSLSYNHETGTQSANTSNHHLEYEVEVPLPDGDRAAAAVKLWLLLRSTPAAAGA